MKYRFDEKTGKLMWRYIDEPGAPLLMLILLIGIVIIAWWMFL